jgi:hypothetical protein
MPLRESCPKAVPPAKPTARAKPAAEAIKLFRIEILHFLACAPRKITGAGPLPALIHVKPKGMCRLAGWASSPLEWQIREEALASLSRPHAAAPVEGLSLRI